MKRFPKPEVEIFERFNKLDLISSRHLNFLKDKSLIASYDEGETIVATKNSLMSFYLIEGCVDIIRDDIAVHSFLENSNESYLSLNEQIGEEGAIRAKTHCLVLQLNSKLIEQYFSLSQTQEFKVVNIDAEAETERPSVKIAAEPLENPQKKQTPAWLVPPLRPNLAKNVSQRQAQEMVGLFTDYQVQQYDIILRLGQSNSSFHVLKQGEAMLMYHDGRTRELKIGDYFGSDSLVSESGSAIQVKMNTKGVIAKIEQPIFEHYLKNTLIKRFDDNRLAQLKDIKWRIIDVRLPTEFENHHREGSINVPIPVLKAKIKQLNRALIYFISADCGKRGEQAVYLMQMAGLRAFLLDHAGSAAYKNFDYVSSLQA